MAKKYVKQVPKVKEPVKVDTMRCEKCSQPLPAGFITVTNGDRYCSPACCGTNR